MIRVLALNQSFIPIEIVTWRRAVSLWYSDKAKIIAEYDDKFVNSPSMRIAVPSVIQYTEAKRNPRFVTTVPFNRRNLFIRDGGRCQYCGCRVSMNSFTFDHVVPRYLGGKVSWENVVAACFRCNGKKGCKILKSSGMSLIRLPYRPMLTKAAPLSIVSHMGLDPMSSVPHDSWKQFIYWDCVRP